MQAIVLVGGEGTRLRPLTDTVPKPALTLVDRPFLAYMIEWLGGHGVTEAVLACGFLPDQLREALGDGEHAGVALSYVVEPDRRGTAGAIRFAAEALGDRLEDRFLALNGDVLTDLDLTALRRAHEERGARATLGLYGVEDSARLRPRRLRSRRAPSSPSPRRPAKAEPGAINAGAYVLERSVLDLIPPGRQVSIETEVFPRPDRRRPLRFRLDGYWMDIGTHERYLQASWDILEGRVETAVRADRAGPLRRGGLRGRRIGSDRTARGGFGGLHGGVRGRGRGLGPARRLRDRRGRRGRATPCSARGSKVAPGAEVVGVMVGADERVGAAR